MLPRQITLIQEDDGTEIVLVPNRPSRRCDAQQLFGFITPRKVTQRAKQKQKNRTNTKEDSQRKKEELGTRKGVSQSQS